MRRALLLLALVGCRQVLGIPGSGDEGEFFIQIGVTGATGATDGASVLVVVDGDTGTPNNLSDDTTVLQDVPLFDGQRYEVVPSSGNCTVTGGSGRVDNADPTGVAVTCDGLAALADFGFSAPITFDPPFTGTVNEPRPLASIIVQQTDWDPEPLHDGASIASKFFMGQPLDGPFPIATGSAWSLTVSNATFERPYIADPLIAPPLAYGFGKSSAPTGGARFGSAIAAAGNEIAVGAPDGTGRVFVSTRTGTNWTETQQLEGDVPGMRFGASIAMTADTLAIAAPGEQKVYLYSRSGGMWMPGSTLTSAAATTSFGTAIAIQSATTILVGDPEFNGIGAVYRFVNGVESGSASIGRVGDRFGESLAVAGNLLAVGAPGDDSAVVGDPSDVRFADAGAVYAFVLPNLVSFEYLKALAPGVDDRFGSSVAIDATEGVAILVVGAPFEDSGIVDGFPDPDDHSKTGAGAAYVFQRQGAWTLRAFVKAPNADVGDNFGRSVAIAGHLIVGQPATRVIAIGSPFEDSGRIDMLDDESAIDSGAIYAFSVASDGTLSNPSYGKADRIGSGDSLGTAIALTSQTLIAGAPTEDSGVAGWTTTHDNTLPLAGAVFTFR